MALGSRPSWVRRLLPGSHPEPALGSMAGVGRLLRGEGAGAPCTGSRPFSCVERLAVRALPSCLCWFSGPPDISTLHTHTPPLHRPPQGRKKVGDLGALHSHRHRLQAPQESSFPPASPVPGCDHDRTICYQGLTNPFLSRREPPSSPPSPTGGEGMWSCREGSQRWSGLNWPARGHLVLP